MPETSVYCLECVCGHHIECKSKTIKCSACGCDLLIKWPVDEEMPESQTAQAPRRPAAA
jgi:hypothetical protein